MKTQILLFFSAFVILASCKNDDSKVTPPSLIGNWQLVEVLADPGNGKGQFQPVESKKMIQFKENGTVITNESFCKPFQKNTVSRATFKKNTIYTTCGQPPLNEIQVELKNQYLILSFISNEGYFQKFKRIN